MTAILLQNETKVYYKMCQVFFYKTRQLLQNPTLLQNASVHKYFKANFHVQIILTFYATTSHF